MSVRPVSKTCNSAGCNKQVASGQLVDSMSVWEITLDDSVTAAKALGHGMGIGDWGAAVVQHHLAEDGKVTHTITK